MIGERVAALAKFDDDVGEDRLAAAPRYGQQKFQSSTARIRCGNHPACDTPNELSLFNERP
jgi:hypothetical protein